jgi:hypothetical protein
MSWLSRLKALILTKSEKPQDTNPWEEAAPTAIAPPQNPWKKVPFKNTPPFPVNSSKPAPIVDSSVWVKPDRDIKGVVLRKVAFVLVLLNIGIGIFFYSNNWQFNTALYTYLVASTLVIGHYIGVTQ